MMSQMSKLRNLFNSTAIDYKSRCRAKVRHKLHSNRFTSQINKIDGLNFYYLEQKVFNTSVVPILKASSALGVFLIWGVKKKMLQVIVACSDIFVPPEPKIAVPGT
jgi:hypothetical protein